MKEISSSYFYLNEFMSLAEEVVENLLFLFLKCQLSESTKRVGLNYKLFLFSLKELSITC